MKKTLTDFVRMVKAMPATFGIAAVCIVLIVLIAYLLMRALFQ